MTPSEIGAEAELEVAAALARAGKHVYLPFFAPHSRVDLRQAFLVPVGDAPTRLGTLRIAPTVSGQKKLIRWAADYAL